jgi:hypothetical protein
LVAARPVAGAGTVECEVSGEDAAVCWEGEVLRFFSRGRGGLVGSFGRFAEWLRRKRVERVRETEFWSFEGENRPRAEKGSSYCSSRVECIEINPRLVREAETESQAEDEYEEEGEGEEAEENLLAAAAKAYSATMGEAVGESALDGR